MEGNKQKKIPERMNMRFIGKSESSIILLFGGSVDLSTVTRLWA